LSIDSRLLLWIAGLAGRYDLLDRMFSLLANDFFIPTAMALTATGLWFAGKTRDERRQNQIGFIYSVTGLAFSALAVRLIDNYYFRARPYIAFPQLIPQVQRLFYEPTVSSFPSVPAAVTFAFALGIYLQNKKTGAVLFCMAALMSLARIYIGIHYPSDILAGATIGVAITFICSRILRRFINQFLLILDHLFFA
jgi:undecaprenyl-diphosphatase